MNQIEDANDPEYQLGLLKSIQRDMSLFKRRKTPNWSIVMNILLQHTSKGGRTSAMAHCKFLGINPDGFTFY